MDLRLIVKLLLLLFVSKNGCYGMFQFDLFSIAGLSASIITVNGTEATAGPIPRHNAIKFSKHTSEIKKDTNYFAYIANTIQNSNDVTFAVYFKIMSTNKNSHTFFPFFALADTKMENNYFSIGFESKRAFSIVEGRHEYNGKVDWTVNIEQWVKTLKGVTKTSLKLGDKLKLGQWMILMVRIKSEDVLVSLDCKPVVKGKLLNGRVEKFSYDGKLTFSQFLINGEKKQFVGSMYEPQLINGQKAYDWYNPCTRDLTPSEIKPEPRPSEYDDTKFKKYQEMSQQDSPKPIVSCTDANGKKRRNNGDPWVENRCYKYRCVDGVVTVKYQCRKCFDGGASYKSNETWVDKSNACKRKRCMYGRYVDVEKLACKKLSCPADEQYTPPGACCKKCRGDDCEQKRVYITSCEKKCSYGGSFKCSKVEKGCWCPKNTALNHEGTECVPTHECKCQVYGKMYLPGQSIKKSLCSNCICSHGKLVCFDTC